MMIFALIVVCSGAVLAEDTVELKMWHAWTGQDAFAKEVLLPKIEEFQKNNPNIKLKIQVIPNDNYRTKLRTQAAGGQIPDIMQTYPGSEVQPLVEAGMLMPLDDIINYWTDDLIAKETLKAYTFNNKVYAIPAKVNYTHFAFYNKDMLQEAGYDKWPATYQEFKKMADKLKENDIVPISLGNKAKWVLQSVYFSTIADRVAGADFLDKVLAGEKKFTDPEFIKALNIIKELADNDYFNKDANSLNDMEMRQAFYQKRAAIFFGGAWDIGGVIENAKEQNMNVGIATFPSIVGAKSPQALSGVTGSAFSIRAGLSEAQQAAAFKFLKFFYSEETYTDLLRTGSFVPAQVPLPDDISPQFQSVINLVNEHQIAPVYDAVLPLDLIQIINNGLQSLTAGQMTAEELAQQMQDNL
jgi:raffinose/stachyose/melibiose transport system substrate-binding protein